MTDASESIPNGVDDQPQVGMLAQYVKDLSFENPNAPAVYSWQAQPQIDINFNISTSQPGDDVHEVALRITAKAVADEGTTFAVELVYAGLFGLRNIPDDQLQPFLLAEAPRLLFPFARRVLADTVQDGGFPPLLLDPIDFAALYLQQQDAQGIATVEPAGNA
jgi:preprotein translocase subunit SecB